MKSRASLWVSACIWCSAAAGDVSETSLELARPDTLSISTLREAAPSPGQESQFGLKAFGFVTPWNSDGYDNAVYFAHKFHWISPVWLNVGRDDSTEQLLLEGIENVDVDWIRRVREAAPEKEGPYIVPRLTFEQLKVNDYMMLKALFSKDFNYLGMLLGEASLQYGFDGATLEMPWLHTTSIMRNVLMRIREDARKVNPDFQVILVFQRPTWKKMGTYTPKEKEYSPNTLIQVLKVVDFGIILMYDFYIVDSNQKEVHETPLAPMYWIRDGLDGVKAFAERESLEDATAKLLLGLPLYGYGPTGAITSEDLIKLHKEEGGEAGGEEFEWDSHNHEHVWNTVDGEVRFPTPAFLVERFKAAKERGMGVALWELGQNFPHVLDYL